MNYSKGIYSNKDWLKKRYVDKEMSLREIAKICKSDFKTIDYWVKKFNFKKHSVGGRKGNKSANWKGGKTQTYGYIAIKINGKYLVEHRIVAATVMKRGLRKGEVVHHIDRVRDNNNPNNLYVFKSQAEHKAYHQALRYGHAKSLKSNLIE